VKNNNQQSNQNDSLEELIKGLKDYGPYPVIFDMDIMTKLNRNFRTALWTGEHLQLVLMSIESGGDIGVEMHADVDQFIRIESGDGIVSMGMTKDDLSYVQPVSDDNAIIIPAGTWHNVENTGDIPLKLYSIYAPPQHPFGTVHKTKADADAAENK